MNQENAPHMQPMEQAGEQGSVPYPPYNEERPATEAAAPNTQPAQTSIPPYGDKSTLYERSCSINAAI